MVKQERTGLCREKLCLTKYFLRNQGGHEGGLLAAVIWGSQELLTSSLPKGS